VLGFFCGIRPEGELLKLEWRDIDWRGREVTIRPEVSKTKRRRFPKLSKNAMAWLNEYRLRGGTTEGKGVVWGKENLRHHRLANRARAGVTRWPHQGMRHSSCSYWLALHKDVNELVLQSGHNDPNTMWRHYHKGTRRAEAVKFWTINPPHLQPRKDHSIRRTSHSLKRCAPDRGETPSTNSLVVLAEDPRRSPAPSKKTERDLKRKKAKLAATFSEGCSLTASVPRKLTYKL
jgi:hypothetical protein